MSLGRQLEVKLAQYKHDVTTKNFLLVQHGYFVTDCEVHALVKTVLHMIIGFKDS